MSQLFLIRHGQASFLQANYDKLSERGEAQARLLGGWIVSSKLEAHAVFCGPRVRQRRTAEIAGEVVRSAGLPFPDVVTLDELDEYRAEELLLHAMGHLDEHPSLREIVESARPGGHREQARFADRVMGAVLERWVEGHLAAPGLETFTEFRARAQRALDAMTSIPGRSRTVLAFTSGGTIGAAVGQIVRADDRGAVDLGLVTHNCAFSEVLFRDGRVSLSSFNRKPHMEPTQLTYR